MTAMPADATSKRDGVHDAAIAALAQSPVPALLRTVDAIQKALLVTEPTKLRRSVGWWGRLIGRDITLQAEALALRGQLDVLVRRAQEQIAEVEFFRDDLATRREALRDAIVALQADADASADATRAPHSHLTAQAWRITAAHLHTVVVQYDGLLAQLAQSLPHVQLLVRQDRMLTDAQARQAAVVSAQDSARALRGVLAESSTVRDDRDPASLKE